MAILADFEDLDFDRVMTAARTIYEEGRRSAPWPSELIAASKRATPHTYESARPLDPGECNDHRWGIMEEDDEGNRTVVCAKCRWEKIVPPGAILTKSELDDLRQERDDRWAERSDLL